jgi:hypothetical protein
MNNLMHNTDSFYQTYTKEFSSEHRDLINKFSLTFSRLEYAMKINPKYCTTFFKSAIAAADWDSFGFDLNIEFMALMGNEDLKNAVDYLKQYPPKRLVLRRNKLLWEDFKFKSRASHQEEYPLAAELCNIIKVVRNNLLHGGKFPQDKISGERDMALLQSSLVVLNYLIDIDIEIKTAFLEGLT